MVKKKTNTLNGEKIENLKKKIVGILKKHKVVRAGIFGSYARGENKKNSDVDILIELSKPVGFGFVGIQFELEDELRKKVDLLSYKAIHPLLKERILKEEIRII
ncbi:MAG: nucleotidyltransferase family protein [Candidatus Omnitrophota bacterium]